MKSRIGPYIIRLRRPNLPAVFLGAWGVPLLGTGTGVVGFRDMPWLAFLGIAFVVLATWGVMRLVRRQPAYEYVQARQLRRWFWITILVAAVGNLLLQRAYSGAGILADGGVQALYIEVLNQQQAGTLSTGPLASLGHLLRVAQPFAMLLGAVLVTSRCRALTRLLAGASIVALMVFSYYATFSRGQLLFSSVCVLVGVFIGAASVRRAAAIVVALVLAGVSFYGASAAERAEALGVDESRQVDAALDFFLVEDGLGVQTLAAAGGAPLLGSVLYFSHSVVEGARLLENEASPRFGGTMSFFPYVNPVQRLLGATDSFDIGGLRRPNMWYSAIGEMYLDFDYAALLLFPAVALAMLAFAESRAARGLSGVVHHGITTTFFGLFPLYSVFQSYGLIFAASALAAMLAMYVRGSSRPRAVARPATL